MRVLMMTHEFPPCRGGIGTYASGLAKGAHELGHELTVVAPDFGHDLAESDRDGYPFEVIRHHSGEYSWKRLPALIWRTWRWSRFRKCDLLHAVDSAYVMSLAFLNKFSKIPFVATAYGSDVLAMPSSTQAKWLMVRRMFEVPGRIFAISGFTRDLLLSRCPSISPGRVRVTPLGIDERWFDPPASPDEVPGRLGIPKEGRIILTVARLDERKGHRTTLKGIARVDASLKRDLWYVVVGGCANTPYVRELRNLAAECGANVKFAGDVTDEDLHALYAAASVYAMPGEEHPGKVEGFGLAYLEAAAQGVPSIASRLGGAPEAVLHEETGLLIEPGDDESFCRALTVLLRDEDLRRRLGNKARERAKSFNWRRCAELTYGK